MRPRQELGAERPGPWPFRFSGGYVLSYRQFALVVSFSRYVWWPFRLILSLVRVRASFGRYGPTPKRRQPNNTTNTSANGGKQKNETAVEKIAIWGEMLTRRPQDAIGGGRGGRGPQRTDLQTIPARHAAHDSRAPSVAIHAAFSRRRNR